LYYGFRIDKEKRNELSGKILESLGFNGNSKSYYKTGWINPKKCESYDNWLNLDNNFSIDEYSTYFEELILPMVRNLKI
jgi:hypothetical protein